MRELHLPEGFTVTAHAGAMGTEDNSLESLEADCVHKEFM